MNTSTVIDKIITQDFAPAYKVAPTRTTAGKTNFRMYAERAGVYIVLEKSKSGQEICYVGMSTYDLYKTISRHFQTWNDSEQRNRISYKQRILNGTHEYYISVLETTARTAKLVEKELILTYQPRDNKNKLEYFTTKSDKEVLTALATFLQQQYGRRRAHILHVLRNPDKYSRSERLKAQKEFAKKFKWTAIANKATKKNIN